MKLLSPAIKAATGFTLGGAAFAVANVLLARHLAPQAYGELALLIAITNLSIPLGPMSLDTIILRHRPGPQPRLLAFSIVSGSIAGLIIASVTSKIYPIDAQLLSFMVVAILAGSVARVAASVYQSEQRYGLSLCLIQSQNITLILVALAVGVFAGIGSHTVYVTYTMHWVVVAVIGAALLLVGSRLRAKHTWRLPWGECPPLLGYLIAAQLSIQLDRLVIPKFLDLESLALFGVLAALVLAPYKMLEVGVAYTLVPGLRGADDKSARLAIILSESRSALLVFTVAIANAFLLAPLIADVFLHGKYVLETTLIAAAVFAGTLQVIARFMVSIVTALGARTHLRWITQASWLTLFLAVLCGWFGSTWGLPGVILGLSAGSLARIIIAALIASYVWNQPDHVREDVVATA
jgi:O-antigen/teichoic acid export membrane protein